MNATIALEEAQRAGGVLAGERSDSATQLSFEYTRLRNTGNDLAKLLLDDGQAVSAASELTTLMRSCRGPDSDAGSGEAERRRSSRRCNSPSGSSA